MRQVLESKIGCGCPYCGVQMGRKRYLPTRDHMIPESRGGTLADDNKVIVCQPCNLAKGDLTIHEFYRALKSRNDPRVGHVARFILSMDVYFAGRLRIPTITREVRDTYPKVAFVLQANASQFSVERPAPRRVLPPAPRREAEREPAPAFRR